MFTQFLIKILNVLLQKNCIVLGCLTVGTKGVGARAVNGGGL